MTQQANIDRFFLDLVVPDPGPYQARAAIAQQAVRRLLNAMDRPQQKLQIIHIAGSKGKGSTALFLEAIFIAAGFRVGTFTSPHLVDWNERFRINGRAVDDTTLLRVIEQLKPCITAQDFPPVSFFDALTACALTLFARQSIDYAILETGLGGRLDATNVVSPILCCITSIELEHTDKLGSTIAAIAREKAGIIKPGIEVVCGQVSDEALAVIKATAAAQQSNLLVAGRDFSFAFRELNDGHYELLVKSTEGDLALIPGSPGKAAAINAGLAAVVAQRVAHGAHHSINPGIPTAIQSTRLPGRCEWISQHPKVIADSAHTERSAEQLAELLERQMRGPRIWLLAFSGKKDPRPICRHWLSEDDHVIVTEADPTRCQPATRVAETLQASWPDLSIAVLPDPETALREGHAIALRDNRLLVSTGSVYMAGLARAFYQG